MNFEIYKDDHRFYSKETAQLNIIEGGDKYNEYHQYILDSLNLITEHFPVEAEAWYQAAQACMDKSISVERSREMNLEISNYRVNVLCESYSMATVNSQAAALTFLFQFAIEHPDDPERLRTAGTDTSNGTALIQAVDEYSLLFIDFFGHGKEMVELLRSNFQTKCKIGDVPRFPE